jgi:hypothetical protein
MFNFKRSAPLILLVGDLIALTLFVYIGQRDHETLDPTHPLLGLLPLILEFGAPWIIAARLLGAFRFGEDTARSRIAFFARTLNAWLVTALMGLLLRAFVLGRAVIPTTFIIATLGFGALFLFAWRLMFALLWRIAARA